VDEHGRAVTTAVEHYYGCHRYFDNSESAPTSVVVPVLLDVKTKRVINYIEETGKETRKDEYKINLLDKNVLLEPGFKEICLYEPNAESEKESITKSFYEIISVRDICSELNKFGAFKCK
jgi:hypothetical protein